MTRSPEDTRTAWPVRPALGPATALGRELDALVGTPVREFADA